MRFKCRRLGVNGNSYLNGLTGVDLEASIDLVDMSGLRIIVGGTVRFVHAAG